MGRVLVVEDDMHVAEITCRMVQRAGHHCEWVRSGVNALDLIALAGSPVDLFIIDCHLPDMSGTALAQKIALHSSAPVIFTTGDVTLKFEPPPGVPRSNFLAKPYELDQLTLVIRKLLNEGDT